MSIFFLVKGLGTYFQSQSILTLIVQTTVSAVLGTLSWQSNKEPLEVSFATFSVTIEEACWLGRENGNNLWWEAICKEMKNARPAFEVFEGKQHDIPPGFQQIRCHMIFDIKIRENFHWKARFVAGGHTTETPASLTYSSVVSCDIIHIALTIAALNDLQVMSCDIQNTYLMATCHEKIWTYAGPEFGSEKGSIMLIWKALYGLMSSGTAF